MLRTADRGYVVTPLDAARSDDAFDARLVIELGVAELTVGRLSPEQLAELRMLAQTSVARLEGGKVPLEESVAIYERGEALKRRCEDLLRQAEARIEKITLDASGKPTGTEPLDVK